MAYSPSAPAVVDDQKNANTCSLFAISKELDGKRIIWIKILTKNILLP